MQGECKMSKYEPLLWKHLQADTFKPTYSEIRAIPGFDTGHSFPAYKWVAE
jgi:hypothetical protein